jgi:hypothetical protein
MRRQDIQESLQNHINTITNMENQFRHRLDGTTVQAQISLEISSVTG